MKRIRRVNQYNINGDLITTYDSPGKAEIALGVRRGSVSDACNRKRLSVNGYFFRYVDDASDIDSYLVEARAKMERNVGHARKVYQYDLNGHYIREWKSVKEARENIQSADNIVSVCAGRVRSSGGYYWSYTKKNIIDVPPSKKRQIQISFQDYCLKNGLDYLLNEWDTEMNSVIPSCISAHSNKKVFWVCRKGHRWCASVASRVSGRGCKECASQRSTSFPEQAIFFYVKQIFPDAINRFSDRENGISEIDVFIPCQLIGVEYDGKQWHQDIQKDMDKDLKCSDAGISLIRIREEGCPNYKSRATLIEAKKRESGLEASIQELVGILLNMSHLFKQVDINLKRDSSIILSHIKNIEVENSLLRAYPKLAEEWDVIKNKGVLPSVVAAKSNQKYWWLCPICGHSYPMIVSNRTRLGYGCPKCGAQKSRQAKMKTIRQYTLDGRYIQSFKGAKDAAKATNLKYSQNINAVCERKQMTAGGFIWRYEDDCTDVEDFVKKNKIKLIGFSTKNTKVLQYSLDGVLVKSYRNSKEVIEAGLAKNHSDVVYACIGKKHSMNGYIWKFEGFETREKTIESNNKSNNKR